MYIQCITILFNKFLKEKLLYVAIMFTILNYKYLVVETLRGNIPEPLK